ncbi:MAG: hypothetical protein ACE5H7_04010 [Acidiferrobacterales bacterium]
MKYGYPFERVRGDYARAAIGFAVMAGLVLFAPLPRVLLIVFAALALLFLGFGVQTAWRHRTQLDVTDDGISATPSGVRIRWAGLTGLSLDYYSVGKESKNGWLQLTLRSNHKKLSIDSRIEGFHEIVRRAQESAHANGLALNPTTEANFSALGADDVATPRARKSAKHG